MSGAQIAAKLVLSPETVRTHVRNAMGKLGASTRSQAVALALQNREIGRETAESSGRTAQSPPAAPADGGSSQALAQMLSDLVSLYDVDDGAIYLPDEDGLSLHRITKPGGGDAGATFPTAFSLGEGALGRAALERRAQLMGGRGDGSSTNGALIAAPMIGAGRLLGVIALDARVSRPIGRSELLLLQALASRIAEVMLAGGEIEYRLDRAMERFRASWSAATLIG